jgi:hypothetical protein
VVVLKEVVLNCAVHNSVTEKPVSGGLFRMLGCTLCFLMTCMPAVPLNATAQAPAAEYQVKAAFLFHFAQLVEWPVDSAVDAPVNLCIFENDSHRRDIQGTVDGKPIGDSTFHVRTLHMAQDARGCSLLFVSSENSRHEGAILNSLRGLPVLTVGEDDGFLSDGGMIRFRLEGDHVRFDVNLAAADSAGLRISSRLLLLATHVLRTSSADARGAR